MAQDSGIRLSWTRRTRADLATTWSALSDTARFNQIAGLDLEFAFPQQGPGRLLATGALKHFGMRVTWREIPVRFEAPRHFLVERLYDKGPLARSQLELDLTELADGGTQIQFDARFWPQSWLLGPAVRLDLEVTIRPKLERALRICLASLEAGEPVPEQAPPPLSAQAERLLAAGLAQLTDTEVARHLGALLRSGPLAVAQRLKPLQLARQWRLDERRVTQALLRAAQTGMLHVQWEVLCPSCRYPTGEPQPFSLQSGKAHCPACDLRYDASLADSVALTLRPSKDIRPQIAAIRCLSSPARMPHIAGQITVPPRQELEWTLDLLPGSYRLRGWPQLDPVTLTVRPDAPRRDVNVQAGPEALTPPTLRAGAGRVLLRIRSKLDEPLTLVLERPWVEPHTLTAGRALEWPEIIDLLPAGALEPGLDLASFTGPVLAVQVARGGETAGQLAAEALRQAGARALQQSTGWVLATFPGWPQAGAALQQLPGALWLSAAIGHGTVLELTSGSQRMAAGALLQDLVALAQDAEPGQVLAHEPATWPADAQHVQWKVLNSEVIVTTRNPLRLPPPPPLAAGQLLDGRFVLGEVVGQGGFGLVLAARDTASGAEVVVKLLRPELADDPVNVQRFFDEGRLAGRLTGPHLVRVHEWGLADDGRLFLAMERLDGRELADVLRESGTIDPLRAMQLAEQALSGLQEAHGLGLVHRDIKPQNLFLVAEGTSEERIKVIDFGIALDLTGKVRAAEAAGTLIGTPVYMSPEQVLGHAIDGRSDLYALAIVLYQCVSGALPFGGDTVMAKLMARLTQPPLSLAQASAQPLPQGLDHLIAQTLAQEPAQRPAGAEAMAAELERVRQLAGPPAQWQASWRAHQRLASAAELADTMVQGESELPTVAASR